MTLSCCRLKRAPWMNMAVIFLILRCHFQARNSSHSIFHSDFLFSNEFTFSQKQFSTGCFPRGIFPIDPVGSSSIVVNAAQLFIKYLCNHSFHLCNFKLVLLPISMHIFQIFLNLSASAVLSLTVALSLPPHSPFATLRKNSELEPFKSLTAILS